MNDCGKTKTCFRVPDDCIGDNCDYVYKWSDNGDYTDFDITAKVDAITENPFFVTISMEYAYVGIGKLKNKNLNKVQ